MTEPEIIAAIDAAAASTITGIGHDIAWPNIHFEPQGKTYAKIDVIPASTWVASLQNKGRIYRGIYQIMIIVPLGVGIKQGVLDAHAISDAMDAVMLPDGETRVRGLPVASGEGYVYLSSPATVGTGFYTDTGYNIPISLNYRADT